MFLVQFNCIPIFGLFVVVYGCMALDSDLHCSSEHLKTALKAGKRVVSELTSVSIQNKRTKIRLERLRRELNMFVALDDQWTDGIARHPVYVFRMVRQLYKIRNFTNLQMERFHDSLPSRSDYGGTITALLRLQDTYLLETKAMTQGIIAGEPSFQMSSPEILDIAAHAYKKRKYKLAAEWFSEAWKKVLNPSEKRTEILLHKALSEFQAGSTESARKTNELMWNYDKNIARKLLVTFKNETGGSSSGTSNVHDEIYKRLCRGESTSHQILNLTLSCHVTDNNRNPLLVLQPAHLEQKTIKSPNITIIRDVLSKHEVEQLKFIAKKQLHPSRVISNNHTQKTSPNRISKGAFLQGFKYTLVRKIQKRIAAVTGLNVNAFETLQVANYGVGGWYKAHPDYFSRPEGDYSEDQRIATVLIYLSDVQAGGATVFPSIGERLVPSIGDAAFWFNTYRNGTVNKETFHAACPVLLGTKWISNQWILRNKNEYHAPCSLQEND